MSSGAQRVLPPEPAVLSRTSSSGNVSTTSTSSSTSSSTTSSTNSSTTSSTTSSSTTAPIKVFFKTANDNFNTEFLDQTAPVEHPRGGEIAQLQEAHVVSKHIQDTLPKAQVVAKPRVPAPSAVEVVSPELQWERLCNEYKLGECRLEQFQGLSEDALNTFLSHIPELAWGKFKALHPAGAKSQ